MLDGEVTRNRGPLGRGVRDLELRSIRACPPGCAIRASSADHWVARTTAGASLVLRFSRAPSRAFDPHELATCVRLLELTSRPRTAVAEASEARFAATLHDLRHLFTLMRWAAADEAAPAGAKAILHDALADAERICERGLAGDTAARTERIDASVIARDAATVAERAARSNRGATVVVEADQPLDVATDATALARLLRNLVINAIECTRSGSIVRVRCTRAGESGVQIEVEDEGPGTLVLPSPSSARAGRVGARGIGLTSVVVAAAELGARLTVAAQLGRGSKVTVYVPSADSTRSIVLAPTSLTRDVVQTELQASGENVSVADDCASALRMASLSDCRALVVSPAAVARDARAVWRELDRQGTRVRLHMAASG